MITHDLLTTPEEMMQVLQSTQSTPSTQSTQSTQSTEEAGQPMHSFLSLSMVQQYLQTHVYLPPNHANTTFGVIAVADSIRSGHSLILQTILAQPDVQSLLLEWNQTDEDPSGIRGEIDSWHIPDTIEQLHRNTHFRLRLLHPVFSPIGWSDCLSQLVQAPDYIARKAYEGVEEADVRQTFQQLQHRLVERKQTYLDQHSLKQLFAEAKAIHIFIREFQYYFNDEYSVADWLQGLIEVRCGWNY